MDVILETNAAVECVRETITSEGRPKPEWIRGICPHCGEDLVSNCYYVGGKGYLVTWDCWASLGTKPTCSYRKVL
jgi:hypothetical protein